MTGGTTPVIAAALLVVLGACTGNGDANDEDTSDPTRPPATTLTPTTTPTPDPSPSPTSSPTSSPPTTPPSTPASYEVDNVLATIQRLAGEIGPREATSAAYHQAAEEVGGVLGDLGYAITTVAVPVPAGNSWGIEVPAGDSTNVIADPPGFDPAEPHVVVGAHLDTVPQAPGAEDNASGVASMLELARVVATDPPSMPVRFVAFGAEEPRGDGDARHHFGSQHYVAALSEDHVAAIVAMVSLDRVGARGAAVPICTGGTGTVAVRDALVAAADTAGVPAAPCADNRSSDHWSFEKADIPSARLGSIPYAAYHSADDVPSVVDERQLGWVGATMLAWLNAS